MIQFKCACCGQLLQLADEWAGKVAKCPFSGQYMQVPYPVSAPTPPVPAQQPVRAAAQKEYYNPFSEPAPPPAPRKIPASPPPAEFGNLAEAAVTDAQRHVSSRTKRRQWQTRGTLLGGVGGAIMGAIFGAMFGALGAAGKSGAETFLGGLSVLLGGGVLGAGVGGLLGPTLLLAMPGVKKISTGGAVRGALYGAARVGGFGALGGLVPGLLHGAFRLLKTGEVGDAVSTGILSALLLALGWAAAGVIMGLFYGAALGAVGGYDS